MTLEEFKLMERVLDDATHQINPSQGEMDRIDKARMIIRREIRLRLMDVRKDEESRKG